MRDSCDSLFVIKSEKSKSQACEGLALTLGKIENGRINMYNFQLRLYQLPGTVPEWKPS